jgi:hypothetical protein
VDWTHLGLRGALGGILLMWDSGVVKKIEDCVGLGGMPIRPKARISLDANNSSGPHPSAKP